VVQLSVYLYASWLVLHDAIASSYFSSLAFALCKKGRRLLSRIFILFNLFYLD